MGLFKDLKIKQQLLEEHIWKYNGHDNYIYYVVDDSHIISVQFNGFSEHKPFRESNGTIELNINREKYILVSLSEIDKSLTPSASYASCISVGMPIFTHTFKLYSKNYLLVKELRKIWKPFFKEFTKEEKNRKKLDQKKIQRNNYRNSFNKIPVSLKREININSILNDNDDG